MSGAGVVCAVALGSNLGDRHEHLSAALAALGSAAGVTVEPRSLPVSATGAPPVVPSAVPAAAATGPLANQRLSTSKLLMPSPSVVATRSSRMVWPA